MKRIVIFFVFGLILLSCSVEASSAGDYSPDYTDIQDVIDDIDEDSDINFGQVVEGTMSGDINSTITNMTDNFWNLLIGEIRTNIKILGELLVLAVVVSIFTNFTSAFNSSYTGEIGFLVVYLVLFSIVFKSFYGSNSIAEETLKNISLFMNVLVPCFLGAVAASGNITTATGTYATMAFGINMIELLVIKIILPAINIYLIVEFMNAFTKEKMLSKAAKALKSGINWTLTLSTTIILGYNGIKSIMLPSVDSTIGKSARRLMGAVPVVGDALDGATETIIGSGMLVKNAIGVGGIIVLIVICLIPILKLLTLTIIYKVAAAIMEPICDKKLVNCIENSGEATKLLLVAVVVSMLLLILLLAIIVAATKAV